MHSLIHTPFAKAVAKDRRKEVRVNRPQKRRERRR